MMLAVPAAASELIEVKVSGLKDAAIEENIRRQLEALPEVELAEADAGTSRVVVSLKENADIPTVIVTNILTQSGLKVLSIERSGN